MFSTGTAFNAMSLDVLLYGMALFRCQPDALSAYKRGGCEPEDGLNVSSVRVVEPRAEPKRLIQRSWMYCKTHKLDV